MKDSYLKLILKIPIENVFNRDLLFYGVLIISKSYYSFKKDIFL
jgi:hypothetical protein